MRWSPTVAELVPRDADDDAACSPRGLRRAPLRAWCFALLGALAGCARVEGPALQISYAGRPVLHGPSRSLSRSRLWLGSLWDTGCVTSAAGRTRCWGADVGALPGLAALPASARIACLQSDPGLSKCSIVDGRDARGVRARLLDDSPGFGACAVTDGGKVRCVDSFGRVQRIRGVRDAVEVAHDLGSGCARLTDGSVKCFGKDSATESRADVADVVDLDVSAGHRCAVLRSGQVSCWQYTNPARLVAGVAGAVSVSVEESIACARLADGGAACWDPHTDDGARRVPGAVGLVEVKVGTDYACGLDAEDRAWCWGSNHGFGLGDAESDPFLTLPRPVPGIPAVVDVELVENDTCARTAAGALWCWGSSFIAAETERSAPVHVRDGVESVALDRGDVFVALAGRLHHRRAGSVEWVPQYPRIDGMSRLVLASQWGCGLVGGAVRCFKRRLPWHNDFPRWLERIDRLPPTVVALDGREPGLCAALADGRVLCWGGRDDDGPAEIRGLPTSDGVAVGLHFACARTRAGEAWCWGDMLRRAAATREPRRVTGLPPIRHVAAGSHHACALTEAGEVWCWGYNHRGQMGRGTTSRSFAGPGRVQGLGQVTTLAAAGGTSCAVETDGALKCWGDNAGRMAHPRGLLRSDHAIPVDPSRLRDIDAPR